MDGKSDSLAMTVHLLAKSGHALLLQRALSRLQEWICLDVCLFLVTERTSPIKYYETYRQKSSRFPGTSVLLFLHEDFGEERIFRIHDFFQHPPWQRVHIECVRGNLPSQSLESQDFYGLDEHMPVWGLRQVHYGTEILRVTLYCSFDNYDDAVRLYEMILQREATMRKSSFCAFVLHATENIAVQLCLKQLPLGMCVDSKGSSVLQFRVHEIGQLVPLLPHPCIPISSTRWQTEDYEGNKILLQVQGSSKPSGNGCSSFSCYHPSLEEELTHSTPAPLVPKRIAVQQKNRTLRAVKNKSKCAREAVHTQGNPWNSSQSTSGSLSWSYNPALSSLRNIGPSHMNLDAKWRHSSHELWLCREEEETNVDTGNRVLSHKSCGSPLNSFSADLRNSLLHSQSSGCLFTEVGKNNLPVSIAKRNKESGFALGPPRASHGDGKEEDEEFFI